MRSTKLAFAFLATASVLFAAEPFAGTWKLNSAKTRFKTGQAPKDQTVTIAESGSDLDVTISMTMADGREMSSHYTSPAAGGEGKVIEASNYDAVSSRRLGPDRREVTFKKDGNVVQTVESRVSKDGKTMTVNVKGTAAEGKPVTGVLVFDRQ